MTAEARRAGDGYSIYRLLMRRLWRDPDFLELPDNEHRLLAIYLFAGPQTNRCGLYTCSPALANEDLPTLPETLPETFRERFRHVCETFGWTFDDRARVLWIPSWYKNNRPANPNVLKGGLEDLAEVPASPLDALFFNELDVLGAWADIARQRLVERYPKRFGKGSGNGSPNQEQEQKQEISKSLSGSSPDRPEKTSEGDPKGKTRRSYLTPLAEWGERQGWRPPTPANYGTLAKLTKQYAESLGVKPTEGRKRLTEDQLAPAVSAMLRDLEGTNGAARGHGWGYVVAILGGQLQANRAGKGQPQQSRKRGMRAPPVGVAQAEIVTAPEIDWKEGECPLPTE